MDEQEAKIQALLKQHNLPQEVRHAAETLATLRFENKNLWAAMAKIQPQHKRLFQTLITIAHACPGNELRIHKSQFLRFKDEYRLDESFDEDTGECVFKVVGLTSELPKDTKGPERKHYTLGEMIMLLEKDLKDEQPLNEATIEKMASTLRALSKEYRELKK